MLFILIYLTSVEFNLSFYHLITVSHWRERPEGVSLDLILLIIIYLCLHVSIPAIQTLVQVSVTTGSPGVAALQKVMLQLVFPAIEKLSEFLISTTASLV